LRFLSSGPKLFVKPSAKSNRHLITNAISHCCLAGIANNDQKNKVLEVSEIAVRVQCTYNISISISFILHVHTLHIIKKCFWQENFGINNHVIKLILCSLSL